VPEQWLNGSARSAERRVQRNRERRIPARRRAPGPRRGGPDAGHGLQAPAHPDLGRRSAWPADAALLGDDGRRVWRTLPGTICATRRESRSFGVAASHRPEAGDTRPIGVSLG